MDAHRAVVAQTLVENELEGIHVERQGVTDRRTCCAADAFLPADSQSADCRFRLHVLRSEATMVLPAAPYQSIFLAFHRTPGVVLKAALNISV